MEICTAESDVATREDRGESFVVVRECLKCGEILDSADYDEHMNAAHDTERSETKAQLLNASNKTTTNKGPEEISEKTLNETTQNKEEDEEICHEFGTCETCGTGLKQYRLDDVRTYYKCDKCTVTGTEVREQGIIETSYTKSETLENFGTCEICGTAALKQHDRLNDKTCTYKCDKCSGIVRNNSSLKPQLHDVGTVSKLSKLVRYDVGTANNRPNSSAKQPQLVPDFGTVNSSVKQPPHVGTVGNSSSLKQPHLPHVGTMSPSLKQQPKLPQIETVNSSVKQLPHVGTVSNSSPLKQPHLPHIGTMSPSLKQPKLPQIETTVSSSQLLPHQTVSSSQLLQIETVNSSQLLPHYNIETVSSSQLLPNHNIETAASQQKVRLKKVKCKQCDMSFYNTCDLRSHVKWRHLEERPHTCSFCQKGFVTGKALRRHLKTHTGELDFGCETCGRRFNQRVNLETHIRTHTGEKPFECHLCGKKFGHNVSRRNHLKNMHKDEEEMMSTVEKEDKVEMVTLQIKMEIPSDYEDEDSNNEGEEVN